MRQPVMGDLRKAAVIRIVEAARLRISEYFLSQAEVSADEALQACNCWGPAQGAYDCPGAEQWRKSCAPNTPSAPYLCQNYTSGCDLFQGRPCNGMCMYYTGPPSCGSCDTSQSCCEASTELGGCAATWSYGSSTCMYGSPILINLNGTTAQDYLTSAANGVLFDITARGIPDHVGWTRANSNVAFLVLDRNGNGVVDNGSELFGNFTPKRDGTRAANGFDALEDLDDNGDGQVNADDGAYADLALWLAGVPKGWGLKAVRLETTDVTDKPIEFAGIGTRKLQIVLTNYVTHVSGFVADTSGRAAVNATVVVFAVDRTKWQFLSRFSQLAVTDENGQFTISALPSGDYFAVALNRLPDSQWLHPEFLESIRRIATELHLGEGQHLTLSLRIQPVRSF